MSLAQGDTLTDWDRDTTLPADQVVAVGAAVADALGYVHARGITQLDVKPANVLLGDRVMLSDFGIAHGPRSRQPSPAWPAHRRCRRGCPAALAQPQPQPQRHLPLAATLLGVILIATLAVVLPRLGPAAPPVLPPSLEVPTTQDPPLPQVPSPSRGAGDPAQPPARSGGRVGTDPGTRVAVAPARPDPGPIDTRGELAAAEAQDPAEPRT
jgi:serine/threonine protein kinase